ncbi:uncharacterized protein LOC118144505 [Callithrix jacchus]
MAQGRKAPPSEGSLGLRAALGAGPAHSAPEGDLQKQSKGLDLLFRPTSDWAPASGGQPGSTGGRVSARAREESSRPPKTLLASSPAVPQRALRRQARGSFPRACGSLRFPAPTLELRGFWRSGRRGPTREPLRLAEPAAEPKGAELGGRGAGRGSRERQRLRAPPPLLPTQRFHFAKSVSRTVRLSSPHLALPLQGHPPSPGRPRLAGEEGRGTLAQREGWRNSGSEEKPFKPGPSTKGFYRDDQHRNAVGRGAIPSAPPPWGPRGSSWCRAEPSECERAPRASCVSRKLRVRAFGVCRVACAGSYRRERKQVLYIALHVDRHITGNNALTHVSWSTIKYTAI